MIRAAILNSANRRPRLKQFVLFAFAGGAATLLQYSVLIALVEAGRIAPAIAAVPAYICGAATSYLLNRRLAFKSATAGGAGTVAKFLLVNLIGLGLNTLLLGLLLKAGWHYLLAQATATILVLFWNFAGAKIFVFRT